MGQLWMKIISRVIKRDIVLTERLGKVVVDSIHRIHLFGTIKLMVRVHGSGQRTSMQSTDRFGAMAALCLCTKSCTPMEDHCVWQRERICFAKQLPTGHVCPRTAFLQVWSLTWRKRLDLTLDCDEDEQRNGKNRGN